MSSSRSSRPLIFKFSFSIPIFSFSNPMCSFSIEGSYLLEDESPGVAKSSCRAATHCNTLQHTATCCNTLLQHTATHCHKQTWSCRVIFRTERHCNTLNHTATNKPGVAESLCRAATHCNTLQHTAAHHSILHDTVKHCSAHTWSCRVIVLRCSTMQHTATHCNTLHHTAAHCNTLQHAATHKPGVAESSCPAAPAPI